MLFRDGDDDRYGIQSSEFFVIYLLADAGEEPRVYELQYFVNPTAS